MSDAPRIGRPGQYVPEPFVSREHETGEMPLDILDIIKLGRERVVHVDDEDLPVRLTLVEERHNAEDLDLLDLADVADLLTDLADIKRVVVTVSLGLSVSLGRVFPSLHNGMATSERAGES